MITRLGHERSAAPRSRDLGAVRRTCIAALYWSPGTHSDRPASTASRPSRATSSRRSHSSSRSVVSAVLVKPGASAVTCTPDRATSACRLSLKEATKALDAP
jgi:hypothetical protein